MITTDDPIVTRLRAGLDSLTDRVTPTPPQLLGHELLAPAGPRRRPAWLTVGVAAATVIVIAGSLWLVRDNRDPLQSATQPPATSSGDASDRVAVPDVISTDVDVARVVLESAEYGLIVEIREQFDEVVPAGIVISIDPESGVLVSRGDTVLVTASSGPSQIVAVTLPETITTLPIEPIQPLAIGDRVMMGAAGMLNDRGYRVDAVANRQLTDVIPLIEQLGEARLRGGVVVLHLGTNGPFTTGDLDAVLAPLRDIPNVIILNVAGDNAWVGPNNDLFEAADQPGDNVILIDWNSRATECGSRCFQADGIHLSVEGQQFYADVIGDFTGL